MSSFLRVPVTAAPGPSGLATWVRFAANAINQAAAVTEAGIGDGDKGDITVSDDGETWEFDSSVVSAFARTILDDTTAIDVRSTIGAQADDATLTALAGLNATAGLVEQTGADTFTKRAIGAAAGTDILSRADGDGRYSLTSHNHTGVYQPLDTQLTDLAALSYTGNASKVVAVKADESGFELVSGGGGGGGTTTNALTMNNGGAGAASGSTFNGSSAVTISYNSIGAQPLDATLTALAAYNTNGLLAQTASDTFTGRTLTPGNSGTTISNGNGVSGNPTITSGVWALAGTGQTATGVYDFAVDGAKANIDFAGLGSFNELLVVARSLTDGTTGVRICRVSVDGGLSFYSSSGDYVGVGSDGADVASTGFSHSTNSTAARTLIVHIVNMKGTYKLADVHTSTSIKQLFVASASDINAVRIANSGGGNITGGTVMVLAR